MEEILGRSLMRGLLRTLMMDSAGDKKNFAESDLPWQLAEDNPVISPCEEINLNHSGETSVHYREQASRIYWGVSFKTCRGMLCLFRIVGESTSLGENIAESCFILRGVEMIWPHSSVESTLVPWRIKQPDCIRQLHIVPVSDVTCNQSLVSYVNIYESAI